MAKREAKRWYGFDQLTILEQERRDELRPGVAKHVNAAAVADVGTWLSILLLVVGLPIYGLILTPVPWQRWLYVALALLAVVGHRKIWLITLGKIGPSEAHVTMALLRSLQALEEHDGWESTHARQAVAGGLEDAARAVTDVLPLRIGSRDRRTKRTLRIAADKIAWHLRRLELWVAIPRPDSRAALGEAVAKDLELATQANWHDWLVLADAELQRDDPAYASALAAGAPKRRWILAWVIPIVVVAALLAGGAWALADGDAELGRTLIGLAVPGLLGVLAQASISRQ